MRSSHTCSLVLTVSTLAAVLCLSVSKVDAQVSGGDDGRITSAGTPSEPPNSGVHKTAPGILTAAVGSISADGPVRADVWGQSASEAEHRRFAASEARTRPTSWRGGLNRRPRRAIGAAIGMVGGFFAGGLIGAALDHNCRCDDPGLQGFLIGAPVGAVVGGILGVAAAGR